MSRPVSDLALLMRSMQPVLHKGCYVFCTLPPGVEPGEVRVLASFREHRGLAVIVEEAQAHAAGWPVVFRAAWITLTVRSELQAVGLTALFAGALAKAGIACNVIAAARHDHLFVPFAAGDRALEVLLGVQRQARLDERADPGAAPAMPIASVLIHVADTAAGLDWYQRAFPQAARRQVPGFDVELLQLGPVAIVIVPADEKCASGAAGSVVYWAVDDLREAMDRLQSLGARLYRGPMAIEDGQGMAQVRDPWGNCIGLRGPMPGEAGGSHQSA